MPVSRMALQRDNCLQNNGEGHRRGCGGGALKEGGRTGGQQGKGYWGFWGGGGGGGAGEGGRGEGRQNSPHQQAELHGLHGVVKCQHEVALCFLTFITLCCAQQPPYDILVQRHCMLGSHITLSLHACFSAIFEAETAMAVNICVSCACHNQALPSYIQPQSFMFRLVCPGLPPVYVLRTFTALHIPFRGQKNSREASSCPVDQQERPGAHKYNSNSAAMFCVFVHLVTLWTFFQRKVRTVQQQHSATQGRCNQQRHDCTKLLDTSKALKGHILFAAQAMT